MTDPHEEIPLCAPPRSWVLDDGTTIRKGWRVQHTPTGERQSEAPAGEFGTVQHFAGPGWATVRWDRGGQE